MLVSFALHEAIEKLLLPTLPYPLVPLRQGLEWQLPLPAADVFRWPAEAGKPTDGLRTHSLRQGNYNGKPVRRPKNY